MSNANYFLKKEIAPGDERPIIVSVNAAYIPCVVSAIETRKARSFWDTDTDYERGSSELSRFQEALVSDMSSDIVSAIDRVYMAVRQLSAGEQFSAPLGSPPVMPVVPPALDTPNGVGVLQQLADMQGELPSSWPLGFGSRPATLADIYRALNSSSEDTTITVESAFDALTQPAEGATIINTIRGFFSDAAGAVEEGGVILSVFVGLAGVIVGLEALSAQQVALNDKLGRIIDKLDGGGLLPQDGNVLSELKSVNTLLG